MTSISCRRATGTAPLLARLQSLLKESKETTNPHPTRYAGTKTGFITQGLDLEDTAYVPFFSFVLHSPDAFVA